VQETARAEAKRVTDEGRRELDELVRRRKDINTEISRVQDVLSALEAFEAPSPVQQAAAREKAPAEKPSGRKGGAGGNGGSKAGAGVGAPRSGGSRSERTPPD
jgi:hypothetical protein